MPKINFTPELVSAICETMERFVRGEISLEQWLKMEPAERSTLAGAIAGNAATHHPEFTYHLLRNSFQPKQASSSDAGN